MVYSIFSKSVSLTQYVVLSIWMPTCLFQLAAVQVTTLTSILVGEYCRVFYPGPKNNDNLKMRTTLKMKTTWKRKTTSKMKTTSRDEPTSHEVESKISIHLRPELNIYCKVQKNYLDLFLDQLMISHPFIPRISLSPWFLVFFKQSITLIFVPWPPQQSNQVKLMR